MTSFNMCTSGAIILKAGALVNSTIAVSGSALKQFADDAEGVINTVARIDYSTDFAGLSTNKKLFLAGLCSDIAGFNLVDYDTSGYQSLGAAQTKLDVLQNNINRGLSLIRDKKQTDFINST